MKRQTDGNPILPWALLAIPVLWLSALLATGYEDGMTLFDLMGRFNLLMERPFALHWTPHTLKFLLVGLALYGCAAALYFSTKENRRPGEEHGSARWGSVRQLCAKYRDKDPFQNTLLTQNLRMGLNGKKHRRNLLQIVIGGSGAGKTRFFCKPNLMQANCSFLVTDPKGEMLRAVAPLLIQKGYVIKVFDLIDPAHSDSFNPFPYIKDDKDAMKLVNNLIKNTTPKNASSNDPFWEKSEIALDTALILYLLHEAPPEEQNLEMVMYMIENGGAREDSDDFQSPLDLLFEALEEEDPDHIAVREYKIFKQAAGKTAKSILISCGARLAPFDIPQLREIMSYDELELDKLGDEKSALFFLISDTDTTYNFLVALAFSQMFNLLCERADNTYGGRLPYHVRVLWDEAANTGQVPGLEKIVAVIRSREISLTLFYQAMSQCKALYKDHSETIMGNMDSIVFLGGREASTLKDISENWLGKATISMQTEGRSRGQSESYSQNMQRLGRELMTTSEITTMPGDKCILQLRGLPPFLSPKYDLKKHPNYKYTAEFDKKKNAFRLESLFRHRPLRLKPEDEYTVYEVDGSDTDEEADLLNFDDLDSDEFV